MKRLILLLSFLAVSFAGFAKQDAPLAFDATDTLEQIQQKIQQNGYHFTVSHNWVFDMPPEQKAHFFSRRPSVTPYINEDIGPLAEHLGKAVLPSRFDWRNVSGRSYIGAVRDQGGCGSCYAFGAAAAAEGTYNYSTGRYNANCADFSESFIAWCLGRLPAYNSHFFGCDGADYDYMELQALVDEGIIDEAYFPYRQSDPGSCTEWDHPRVKFAGWYRVPCGDIAAIKTAIMTYGVVDAAVYVNSAFEAYDSGIFDDASMTTCGSSPCYYTPTNHAIALVGWDDAEGVFFLRNSWGAGWGENGYMRIKYNAVRVACEVCYLVYGSGSLSLTAPNGGESWQKGAAQSITWDATGLSGTVTLELWRNGAKVGTIAEGLALTPASYSWTVGNFVGGSAAPGGGYSVRVLAGGKSDDSDASFTIWTPGLTVTSPNGGESWTRHDTRSIQWTSLGLSGNVKLELLQNGSPLGVIAASVPISAGSHSWDVGFVNGAFPAAGSTYSVRVSTVDNLYSDASDAAFTLANRTPALPAASDIDRDGKTDIFWRYYNTGGFNCVWLMGLSGSPVAPTAALSLPTAEMDTPPAPRSRAMAEMESNAPPSAPSLLAGAPFVAAVDDVMDGDGPHADPPVADPRTLGYARNLPTAGPLAWRMGGVADFDGDGRVDILWRNTSDGRNVVWCMNGLTIRAVTQLQQVATSLNWEIGGVGDFNADGRTDIVWRNYTNGRNVIWLMDRFTIKQVAALPSETDANWRITGVCDFTGDGNPDILWRHVGDGRNLVWPMNRVNQVGTASLPTVANLSWEMAACGDFTDDGEMDLVWRNTADGRVVVWKMDRFSLMSTIQLNPVSDPNWKIENN